MNKEILSEIMMCKTQTVAEASKWIVELNLDNSFEVCIENSLFNEIKITSYQQSNRLEELIAIIASNGFQLTPIRDARNGVTICWLNITNEKIDSLTRNYYLTQLI